MNYRSIRDVSARGVSGEYDCTLELMLGDAWARVPYTATPGGGGICDAVLADIASGNFAGNIAPYAEPPAALPHDTPLTRPQWIYGLERHELYDSILAAVNGVTDNIRRATLRSSVFNRDTYHYADALALIANNQDILPTVVANLTEIEMQAMWATTLTEMPT